ncbi:hypothetical protein SDC9_92900 [bioreactor metagenome]|uniref:Uncharacterized protein n=1 Tax=bioreactor metagenome TaxID=1076179 RepID=A0A644ZZK0_9ZZZZ
MSDKTADVELAAFVDRQFHVRVCHTALHFQAAVSGADHAACGPVALKNRGDEIVFAFEICGHDCGHHQLASKSRCRHAGKLEEFFRLADEIRPVDKRDANHSICRNALNQAILLLRSIS